MTRRGALESRLKKTLKGKIGKASTMPLLHTFLRFFSIFGFFLSIYSFSRAPDILGRHSSNLERNATFIEHLYSVLDVQPFASMKVKYALACGLQCLNNVLCNSFNFAANPDNSADKLCELLDTDKYSSSYRFEPSRGYHHYSIASPCEYSPCQSGVHCRPLYGTNGFMCLRGPGYIERASTWLKVNTHQVCFGAKDDAYGNFTARFGGAIEALKLVYISGFVTCNIASTPYGSHWACRNKTYLGTLVTDANNKVILPQDYRNISYMLPGYHYNSSELMFKAFSPPLRVSAGEEFRIWYHEDYRNHKESNNAGSTCADVYALYA